MKHKFLFILTVILVFFTLYACLVCLPYREQAGVSTQTETNFAITDYYDNNLCQDRASVLAENGEALAERIRLISHAENRLILSTFDFKADNSGKQILATLQDAVARGVSVQILVDGYSYFTHMKGNPYFQSVGSKENITIT